MIRAHAAVAFALLALAAGIEAQAQPVAPASAKPGALTSDQQAEVQARMEVANRLLARVEPAARDHGVPDGWRQDAMYMLLALSSAQLQALMGDARSVSLDGMRSAARELKAARRVGEKSLGSTTSELVFNPITPCRNADTRVAGGKIAGGTARAFDADSAGSQGGTAGCGFVPLHDASAWALNITVVNMTTTGYVAVRSVGTSNISAVANFTGPGQQVNNFVIVQNNATSGSEWEVYASVPVDVIIDLFGYFYAPAATQLDCTFASSAVTSVPVNAWTDVLAACPAGYSATGGGWFTTEGSGGYPGVWVLSLPQNSTTWRTAVDNQTGGNRNIQTWVTCCRVPGF